MFYRTATPLHLDNKWRKKFVPGDGVVNLPTNLATAVLVQMKIRRKQHNPDYSPSDWWYGSPPYDAQTIGTDTGEIVNAGWRPDCHGRPSLLATMMSEANIQMSDGTTVPFVNGGLVSAMACLSLPTGLLLPWIRSDGL